MNLLIQGDVSLAELSTFGIGGRARFFVNAKNPEELIEAIRWVEEKRMPYRVMAGGSNIVFPDEGMDGVLIRFFGGKISISTNNPPSPKATDGHGESIANKRISESTERIITADAGVILGDVIKEAISRGWSGLETLSGIPGTIGGAVYGNAGAYGHSISEVVEAVEVLDGDAMRNCEYMRMPRTKGSSANAANIKWLTREECEFGYRESIFKHNPYIVLRVRLKFENKDEPRNLRNISKSIIKLREKKYKLGIRCPGSFFKNVLVKDVSKKSLDLVDPSKIIDGKVPAGWLLEQAGAKGMREGGIYIADFHGNLFVNDGEGMARDVKALARILKDKVFQKFGIKLEEEIRYF